MTYPTTQKGTTWILDGEWKNDSEAVEPVTKMPAPTEPPALPTSVRGTTEEIITPTPTITTIASVEPTPTVTSTKTTAIKSTAPKTTTSKTTDNQNNYSSKDKQQQKQRHLTKTELANIIYPSTIEQILMQPQSLRVRVQGVVGTVPGILLKRQFILQAPDGRGLLVKVPTGQKTPTFGATCRTYRHHHG
jgi:hypothetical protein